MIIQFHSITDLITNSSTTIYTYSNASADACIEMVDEIFKTLGVNKKCKDVFILTVLAQSNYEYLEDEDDDEDEDEKIDRPKTDKDMRQLIDDIIHGKVEKPKWMTNIDERQNSDGLYRSTILHIVAKSPEFERLAILIKNFLYSTSHEGSSER